MNCENREKLHDVDWTSEDTICKAHWDATPYSNPPMCVKMHLIWMNKKIQKIFRNDPDKFQVCNIKTMREDGKGLARYDIVMSIQFLDLFHWAKLRDFGQEMNKDSDYGLKENLLPLAKFLDKGLPSALSGTRAWLNV